MNVRLLTAESKHRDRLSNNIFTETLDYLKYFISLKIIIVELINLNFLIPS